MLTLQDWVDIATIISLLVASGVAIYGLNSWRVQTKRKFDWKLARRCRRAIYAERDALQAVRSPITTEQEQASAVAGVVSEHPGVEFGAVDPPTAVYVARWKDVIDADAALQTELLEVEAAWGGSARDLIAGIREVRNRLQVAVARYLDSRTRPAGPRADYEKDLYNSGTEKEPDEFTQALNSAVKAAENFLVKEKMKL